jgi:hypothetical protein
MSSCVKNWRLAVFLVGVPLVLAAGCSDGRKPVYPVQGQVLWKGKAPAGAQVVFHPVGQTDKESLRPAGQVDKEGKFNLTTFSAGDGAPAGDYEVTVDWWESPGPDMPAVNKLPAAYGKQKSTKLRATVAAGPNQLQPFELK